MKWRGIASFIFAATIASGVLVSPAIAQDSVSPIIAPASPADIQAMQAQLPVPATTPPPADTLTGNVGSNAQVYALAMHSHPRVSFSPVATTTAAGTFSGTFPAGFFGGPPTVALTWESAVNISCQMTSVTATTFSGRCNLLAGLLPTGAGVTVHVVAVPRN